MANKIFEKPTALSPMRILEYIFVNIKIVVLYHLYPFSRNNIKFSQ